MTEQRTSAEWYRDYVAQGGRLRIYSAHGWTSSSELLPCSAAEYWQTVPIANSEFFRRFHLCTITTNTKLFRARRMPFTGEFIVPDGPERSKGEEDDRGDQRAACARE
jgi:hypothetical protein